MYNFRLSLAIIIVVVSVKLKAYYIHEYAKRIFLTNSNWNLLWYFPLPSDHINIPTIILTHNLFSRGKITIIGKVFGKSNLIFISANFKLLPFVTNTVSDSFEQKISKCTLLVVIKRISSTFVPIGSIPFKWR